ncbi:MAG: hypothetical protein IPO53_01500 [Chitinophagaceae bacterium]|nr:hypothetical protein [Chitinophagaceae bacterium]
MKLIFTSISFLCYFMVTSGVTVNSHYCMKRLVSTHLFEVKAKVCGRCGMITHTSNGCCRDEVKIFKLQQDQNKIPVVFYSIPALEKQVIIPSLFISASFIILTSNVISIIIPRLYYLFRISTCRIMFSEFEIQLIN